MSTKLIGFQYHTTAVGNKSSSIFLIGSRNVFGGMGAALIRQAVSVLFRAACLQVRLLPTMPVAVKKSEIAAKERDGPPDVFRRYSQTAGRALSLRLRQIVGRRPKDTHDSRLPSRDAP